MRKILITIILLILGNFFCSKNSFAVLVCSYQMDNNVVKYCGQEINADLNFFKQIKNVDGGVNGYAKDKNTVFLKGKIIKDADPNTFELIPDTFYLSRDKDNIFSQTNKLESIKDPETFKIIKNKNSVIILYKDKYHLYKPNGEIVNKDYEIDTASFEFLSNSDGERSAYSKDKNNVYCCEFNDLKILSYVDVKTFQVLENSYSKDKNNVYYKNSKLADRDAATFQVLENSYSKDKNNVYYKNSKLADRDAATFEVLKYTYSKDKNNVYYRYPPKDNEIFQDDYGNIIKRPDVIETADPKTFKIIDARNTKDKNHVYYHHGHIREVEDVDIDSYEVIDMSISKDKNNYYYQGNKADINDPDFLIRLENSKENIKKNQRLIEDAQNQTKLAEKINMDYKSKKNWVIFTISGLLFFVIFLKFIKL